MKTATLFVILMFFLNGFTQEIWTKYDEGPVLKRDTTVASLSSDFFAISDCWVIRDGDQYKMWYTCGGFNHPTDEYNMKARICYCESEDGVNWEKYSDNPVLDVDYESGWDSLGVETATVIIDTEAAPTERYKMWYAGVTETGGKYNLGYAFSPDGLNWTKNPEAVLTVGGDFDWDNGFLEGPSVIKDGGIYKMWYAAFDQTFEGSETDGFVNIGYATSLDGINWEKYVGNPVLTVSESDWDSIYVQDPHVIKQGGIYHLWYGGASQYDFYGQETGYASSVDGINWVKSPLNPVLTREDLGSWDANTTSFPSVLLEDDGQLKMWYTGKDIEPLPEGSSTYFWEIGYALGTLLPADLRWDEYETFQIYPNPATDFLVVEAVNLFSYTVTNTNGELILTGNGTNATFIDLGQVEKGLYLITIKTEDVISVKKIVKY